MPGFLVLIMLLYTEAKVVAKLKAEGINKNDLTREFLAHAWDWTEKYGVIEQLKKIRCFLRLGEN
jgi:valyl-tRNA synthetase